MGQVQCMSPLVMLWTAPPPARKCQRSGCCCGPAIWRIKHASDYDDWSRHRKVCFPGAWHRRGRQCPDPAAFPLGSLTRQTLHLSTRKVCSDNRSHLSLSKAHDILTQEQWEGASLAKIVENAISVYSGQAGNRFEVDGPDLWIPPNYALAFSLAFHELCTNAIKYGALSNETGSVRIAWTVAGADGTRELRLRWTEIGGPTVSPPKRRGFGTRLVGEGLRQDLAGNVKIDFNPTGVICEIDAPLNSTSFDDHSSRTEENAEQRT
jgi:two-component sensor histidine kinase